MSKTPSWLPSGGEIVGGHGGRCVERWRVINFNPIFHRIVLHDECSASAGFSVVASSLVCAAAVAPNVVAALRAGGAKAENPEGWLTRI
jgi:hypothetical protein